MQTTSVSIDSLTCAKCGATWNSSFFTSFFTFMGPLAKLKRNQGCCGRCRNQLFHVDFRITVTFVIPRTWGDVAGDLVGDLFLTIIVDLPLSIIFGFRSGSRSRSSSDNLTYTSTREVSLADVLAFEILDIMQQDSAQIVGWLHQRAHEQAKANLRPNQGICFVCDEVFTKGLAGPCAHGFCSPLCEKKLAKPEAFVHAPPISLTCPQCKHESVFRSGVGGAHLRCEYCGSQIQ